MKLKMICIFVLLIMQESICCGQKMYVKFNNEHKEYKLNNDFEILFVIIDSTQKTIIKPVITGNSFDMPNFLGHSEGNIVFKYGKLVMDLETRYLGFDQSCEWKIIFDKKPYEEKYNHEKLYSNDVEAVAVISFIPLEHGDTGVIKYIPIKNIKKYLSDSKKLIE